MLKAPGLGRLLDHMALGTLLASGKHDSFLSVEAMTAVCLGQL